LQKDKQQLERVQRRAARFVTGDTAWTSSVTSMLKDLGWESLKDRRRDIRLALFYKAVHGLTAISTIHILIRADERTRSSHPYKFRHITARTSVYHNSFFPCTVPDWNLLPIEAVMPATPNLVSTVSPDPPPSI